MDAAALAVAAVGVLAPYVGKAGEALAESAGNSAWQLIARLKQAIATRLGASEKGRTAYGELQENPASPDSQQGVAKVLQGELESDPDFFAIVAELCRNAAPQLTQQVDISGRAGDVTQFGVVHGSVNLVKGTKSS